MALAGRDGWRRVPLAVQVERMSLASDLLTASLGWTGPVE